MRLVAWVKTREKMIAPLLLLSAAALWVVAVVWHVLAAGLPLWSAEALASIYAFGLGGKTGEPLEATLLTLAAHLGKGGAALAAICAYLKVLDISLDKVWLRYFYRDHVVIVGLGEKTSRLARSLKAAGRRVAVIELNDSHPSAPFLRAAGVAVLHGDGRAADALQQASITRASTLVCLTSSDAVNLQVARTARELVSAAGRATPLRSLVHVADHSLRQIASEAPQYRKQDARFDGHVLDVVDVAARALLAAWAPDRLAPLHAPDAPRLHVLVVGSEALARSIVVNLALQAHYATPQRPVVTLLDPGASQALVQLTAEYPAVTALLDLRAEDASLQHLSQAQLLECTGQSAKGAGRLPSLTLVCVTIARDIDALAAGLHLARLTRSWPRRPQTVVGLPPDSDVMACVGVENTGEALGFATFDRYSICSAEALLGEALDREARARHGAYLEKIQAAGKPLRTKPTQFPWDELDEMVKAFNRRQVEHEPVKRRALAQLGHDDQAIEQLAQMEHRRWMADQLMSGWSWGAAYDWNLRRHNNLVPYEQLDEATKDFDRLVVRALLAGDR
jgi:hypothetical protein